MNTLFLLTLMIFTIAAAFALGIALGYWAICGILNFFNPTRLPKQPAKASVLAPTASGD